MADYAANISISVLGQDKVNKLEDAVKALTENISKLNKAALDPFKGQITALRTINGLLKSNAKLLESISAKSIKTATGGGGRAQKVDTVADEKRLAIQRESLEILGRQVNVIRAAAAGSSNWSDVMSKLVSAQVEMQAGSKANLTLIRTLLRNAQQILREERAISGEIRTHAQHREDEVDEAARLKNEIKELADFERDITRYLREQNAERNKQKAKQKQRMDLVKAIANPAGQAAGMAAQAVDGAFGNAFSKTIGGGMNAAIRGLGTIGILATPGLGSTIGTLGNSMAVLEKAIPGPDVLSQFVKGLGSLVSAGHGLEIQTVGMIAALMAFGPAIGTAVDAAIQGLPTFGKLGKAMADVSGLSERAKPALDSIGRSLDTLMGKSEGSFLANGLFGLGSNSLNDLKFPDLDRQLETAKEVFTGKLANSLNTAAIKSYNQALQQLSDRMNQQRAAAQTWNTALEDGKDIMESYRRKTLETAQALMDLGKARPITAGFGDTQREIDRLDALKRKQQEINRARAEYFGTNNQSRQQGIQSARAAGVNTNVPALRPSGFTDDDVRIANSVFDSNKKLQLELKKNQSITDEIQESWKEVARFAAKTRYEISQSNVKQATAQKATQTSLLNSKLRLEVFKRQNAELEKQRGLYARIARQIAKNMDENGPEGFKKAAGAFGENLALGVGFPLLFGGGPGSVVGSGIGSLFGSGFGGQILGGAIGQILDQAVAAAQALGNALGSINIDTLLEQGIALTGELQQQVEILKGAGQGDAARELLGREIGKQTGDFGGKQLELAAGSVNELQKAWNGVVNALRVAVGVLASPFIQALTAILRVVQGIVVAWNSVVDLAGKLSTGFLNLIGIQTEDWYDMTRKNTAEYEKQVLALKQIAREQDRMRLIERGKTDIDDEKTLYDSRRTTGFTQSDKEFNERLKFLKQREDIVQKTFELELQRQDEISNLEKEFADLTEQERKAAIDAIEGKYKNMHKRIDNERRRLDKEYQLTVEQHLNQRAQLELKQAEAAQALRRRAVALDRGAEDLRLNAEQTILSLRRQGAAIERQAAELRESIEDRIYSKRREIQQMQLDISRRREQLAIDEADLAAKAAQTFTGAAGESIANQLLDSTRQVMKVRAEGEADIRSKELELKLKIEDIDRETRKFELDIAKKIEQIKNSIADYERAAAAAELRLSRSAADLKVAAADYAVAKRKEEIALMEEAAARIATSQLAQQMGGAYTNTARAGSSSEVKALVKAANDLGVSAKDLAAIISYETGGTFSPSIRGGRGGNYEGLIQFGPEERKTYGVKPGMSFEEQITGPVVRYLKDRFAGVGRSTEGATLSDLYRTVNGGNPNRPLTAEDGNGTIAQHIAKIAKNHGASAEKFLGGNVEITRAVKEGTIEGNEQSQQAQQATEATRPETAAAKARVDAAIQAAELARSQIQPSLAVSTSVDAELQKNREIAEQRKEVHRLEADTSAQEAKKRLRDAELASLQKAQQLMVTLKQPVLEILENQRVAAEMREREAQLIAEGMLPAQVQQTLEVEKQVNQQLKLIDGSIALVESNLLQLKAQTDQTDQVKAEVKLLEQRLQLLRAARGEVVDAGNTAVSNVADANSPGNRLTDNITKTQEAINKLQDPVNIITGAAGEMGTAFSEAFKGIITGSMSASEAFGKMAQRMGDYFIDMAMDMLAQYVKLITMQAILKALGGPSLGGGGAGDMFPLGNDFQLASGGRALPGGSYIVGERGPEIFTPDTAGSVSSNRHFDAARDSMSMEADNVATANSEQREEMFYESMQARNSSIEVRYDANVINDVRYVTEDQFQKGMRETATNARARTMGDLRNYPRRRGSIGLK